MRFERSIAVLVLATGVIGGAFVVAAKADDQAKPAGAAPAEPAAPGEGEATKRPPGVATVVGENPWKQAQLKPEHAILNGLVGKFSTKVHLYSGPYARKLDTDGTAEGKVVMGGPFVQLTHSEKRMREPYEEMMIFGFDQAIGKYTADVIDNTSTAIVRLVGTYDAAQKQIVMNGHYSDQQSRSLTVVKSVITFVDANTWTYDRYNGHKAGEAPIQIVTITFKR